MANRFFPNYDTYKITSPYGERVIFGSKSFHHGIDLVARADDGGSRTDRVMAHTGGTVTLVGYNDSIGNYIYIEIAKGVEMAYFHFKDKLYFKVGEKIKKGQVLGYMGATGKVTGAHLHWAIRVNGEWIDPEPYLDKDYTAPTKKKYVGVLDGATTSLINGWAWDSVTDNPLVVKIKIYTNNVVTYKTLQTTADIYRSDLKSAGKGNGKHAFRLSFDFNTLPANTYTIRAFAGGKMITGTKKVVVIKKVQYFKMYKGASTSITEALKNIGEQYSYAYRAKIAKANNIKLYVGSAKQNTSMLSLLRQGKLIKP